MEAIILASGSPQRQEYFRQMGLTFSVMVSRVDETVDLGLEPSKVTAELAKRKVLRIAELLKHRTPPWICGADTMIALDGEALGKPKDQKEAASMLRRLSGREHQVFTSVALFRGSDRNIDCCIVESGVRFASLEDSEIDWYLNSGEWQGVAGAYKIQGMAGCFIEGISGSYSGIVGLPLREFYVMLKNNGYQYGG
jgi:septum formation protein